MTNVALSNNLAVVFRHLEEVGNLHAALGDSYGVLPARLGHAGVQAPRRDTRLGR